MSFYSSIAERFTTLHRVQGWPEMLHIMSRSAALQPRHWSLPMAACEAVGGSAEQAVPAALAVACLHIGILLIDDLLDEDPRGHHHRLGTAAAANLGAAFQLASVEAIGLSELPAHLRQQALRNLVRTAVSTAFGQRLDAENTLDEALYWQIVRAKSGPFFGTALYLGALCGGASPQSSRQIERFGRIYGEMIQIYDDLHDAMERPANPDWTQGRAPLPILFALVVDHPEKERFQQLRRKIDCLDHLVAAQEILLRCGAVSYGVDQLLRRFRSARQVVQASRWARPQALIDLLEDVILPVQGLLHSLDPSAPSILRDQLQPAGLSHRCGTVAHVQAPISSGEQVAKG